MFRDLGLPDDKGYDERKACSIIRTLVNDTRLEARVINQLHQFQQQTTLSYDTRTIPEEKKRRDAQDVMRHMYLGYRKPCPVSKEDYIIDKTVTTHSEYAFVYALDLAIRAGITVPHFLENTSYHDPLTACERIKGKSNTKAQVLRIEERLDFKVGEMPHRLVVYAVDRGAGKRAVMTYEQIVHATVKKMTSIGRYGLVPGGVVGGNFHQTIFGSVDRADLCMLNYDTQHQAAVLCPVDRFAQAPYSFKSSIAVMVNGDKAKGLDLIVTSAEKENLPFVSPHDLVLVVPTTMSVTPNHSNIIYYDPAQWGNFHIFNEWLQTTAAGTEILEHALGRKMNEIKNVEEILRKRSEER